MPNALLVSPKNPITFWSFDEALKMIGKKNAFPPLGLLTIAGMMPEQYQLRLVDMNVNELPETDLEWADVVITSSMIIHWDSLEDVIGRCNGGLSCNFLQSTEGWALPIPRRFTLSTRVTF